MIQTYFSVSTGIVLHHLSCRQVEKDGSLKMAASRWQPQDGSLKMADVGVRSIIPMFCILRFLLPESRLCESWKYFRNVCRVFDDSMVEEKFDGKLNGGCISSSLALNLNRSYAQ